MRRVFCEWGENGIAALKHRVGAIIVVDVLSFSTAVDIATARGGSVLPFPFGDRNAAAEASRTAAAILAAERGEPDGYSLSPASLLTLPPGTRLLLPSRNGSRLSLMGGDIAVFAGCLRNANAVASSASRAARSASVAVIPAGEQWAHDQTMRPAVEDWIGAGAIVEALGLEPSAEALLAREAFRSVEARLTEFLRACMSGQELIERGLGRDVDLAAECNVSTSAPRLMYSDGFRFFATGR